MDVMVKTRLAQISDAVELARLNRLFNGVEDSGEQIKLRLADPRRVETPLIAEIEGRVVGFAAVRVVPTIFYAAPHAELTELFVEEAFRRQGVARALVAAAEALAREGGADEMVILTDTDNEGAQALYMEMGFTQRELALLKPL